MPENTPTTDVTDDEATETYVPACPLDDCNVSFLGATEDDVVEHVLTDHAERIHPHWTERDTDRTPSLTRLVREAEMRNHTETPSTEVDATVTTFLETYRIYLFLAALAVIFGWPFVLELVFA